MSEAFRLGVNYWPARTAMGWWRAHDPGAVAADFERIAGCGMDSVRIFLLWEDFQPGAAEVDGAMLRRFVATLDLAADAGLDVMPTLFTGHMSGINWIPPWALGGTSGDARFRVVSGGRVHTEGLASWYSDASILRAQAMLARELAGAATGHRALWAWDLGNENSNCVIPPDRAHARTWLTAMTDAIRRADARTPITIGLHMEDLESDRRLGPREAAEACDFLTMHGYPGYASWTDGPTDERLLPFLVRVTRWLGGGAEVLFSEFGVPTHPAGEPGGPQTVTEEEAASYVDRALGALLGAGSTGAMLWCNSDYAVDLWDTPPFDLAVHERLFGLWRADGTPKPTVAAVAAFAGRTRPPIAGAVPDAAWLDIDAEAFLRAPGIELPRLYRRFCDAAITSAP